MKTPFHVRRWLALTAAPLWLVSCAADSGVDVDATEQALTSVIPTSKICNQGLGPSQCVQVPPIEIADASARAVDGTHGPKEYLGATVLPFTTDTAKAGSTVATTPLREHGRVHVQYVKTSSGTIRNYLYVMLEDIHVPVTSSVQSKVAVYIDNARFDGGTDLVAGEDTRYLIDLGAGGTITTQKPTLINAQPVWMNSSSFQIGLAYAPGGCTLGASGRWARCNGELRIPLASTATTPPATGLDPGIGFLVRSTTVTQASAPALAATDYTAAIHDRTAWPTLLLAEPRGFDLKIMSWNVRRFEPLMELSGFGGVLGDHIGAFLYDYDIVAIQEGWDRAHVEDAVEYANWLRVAEGKPKYKLYGPVDYEPSWSDLVATVVDSISDTQGGLWVISHLPLAASGYEVFPQDACRGEDCFKAKGVQWVRLMMQDPASLSKNCAANKAESCDKLPSGDDYIDVFNTHLQASDTLLCTAEDDLSSLMSDIVSAFDLLPPWLEFLIPDMTELVDADVNCKTLTDRQARTAQLGIMNQFIRRAIGPKPDRPALVMGDFNIDGKRIHDPLAGDEYRKMLTALEITSNELDDTISTIPGGWDVEHGDLARELDTIDFSSGICLGTAIGETDGWPNSGCPMAGKSDAEQRLDYILVRPPQRTTHVTAYPRWYAVPGEKPWSSPFPSISGAFAYEPPARLSDHKPIVAGLTFARLDTPPSYNSAWPHDVELRVFSLDATGYDDCIGCGEIDPYAKLERAIEPAGAVTTKTTYECTGVQAPSFGNDPCMASWYLTAKHTPPNEDAVILRSKIREADDTSDDDTIDHGTWTRFSYDVGGVGVLRTGFRLWDGKVEEPGWPIYETGPMFRCTSAFSTVCYRVTLTERTPSP